MNSVRTNVHLNRPQRRLRGVIPVLQTPLTDSGLLDIPDLRREVEWIVSRGVSGVAVGMVSEILRFSTRERERLAEETCTAAKQLGRVAVVSCSAEDVVVATSLARHAEESGADAVMANPPATAALDSEAIRAYYSEIIESVNIPVVVQDASGYVGTPISISLQAELLSAYPETLYFKPETPPVGQRFSMLRDATKGRAHIFEGLGGAFLVDSVRRGAVGSMPGADVCWAIEAMWRCATCQRWVDAYRINNLVSALMLLQTGIDMYVAVEKYLLVRQGVLSSARRREPTSFSLDHETAEDVDRIFDSLIEAVEAVADIYPFALRR